MEGPELKVSVIIPAYNADKTLGECLASILNQTYKNYEVIVIDNNSTDKTKEIICGFKKNNARIKYVFAAERSAGSARNEGIKAAQGNIFVFTDADCILPYGWIEEITLPIRLENENAVVGFEEDLAKNYWTKEIQRSDEVYMRRCSDGKYTEAFDAKNGAIEAGLMKNLMFDKNIKMLDDLDLAIRITMKAKIRYLPSVKVGHFHRSSLKDTIRMYFIRAFWSFKIYSKYKKENHAVKNIMFENMRLKKWALFPFWMLFQCTKRPLGEAYFILVTELSWRAGLLWSVIKRR